jgi:hypothetical protein
VVAFHFHNGSSYLSLVLLGGDDGADVEDLSIFSNELLATTSSVSSSMCLNSWATFVQWCRATC